MKAVLPVALLDLFVKRQFSCNTRILKHASTNNSSVSKEVPLTHWTLIEIITLHSLDFFETTVISKNVQKSKIL